MAVPLLPIFEMVAITAAPGSAPRAAPDLDRQRFVHRVTIGASLAAAAALIALFLVGRTQGPGGATHVAGWIFAVAVAGLTACQVIETRLRVVTVLTRRWLAILALVGVVFAGVGAGLLLDQDSWTLASNLLPIGVFALYVAAGLGIRRIRAHLWQTADGPMRGLLRSVPLLVSALGVLVLLACGGFLLLGRQHWLWPVALVGGGLLPMPLVISVLSEHGIAHFASNAVTDTRRTLVGWAALLGTGGLIAAVTVPRFGFVYGAGALLLLALLVAAIASSTLVDVAAVLGLLALLSTTPSPAGEQPVPRQGAEVLVALGDSYMSGEGASKFYRGTDDGGKNECRRAPTAWAARLAAQDRSDFAGLVFLACSGANTYNVRTPDGQDPKTESQYDDEPTQLAQYAAMKDRGLDPRLVVLSIGGNDAGFATIGLTCLAPGDCSAPEPEALFSKGNLDRVENRLRQTYTQVRDDFRGTPVVVIPYPDPIDADHAPCREAPLSPGDIRFVGGFLTRLNARVEKVAEEFGFYYAGSMARAMEAVTDDAGKVLRKDLRLCATATSGDAGVNFLVARSVGGASGVRFNPAAWKHGSLHPNEVGHEALLRAFRSWLDSTTGGQGVGGLEDPVGRLAELGPPSEPPPAPQDEKYPKDGDTDRDCAQVGDKNGCTDQATAWALRQVGAFLLGNVLVLLLVVGGAWLGSVVVIASFRRRWS